MKVNRFLVVAGFAGLVLANESLLAANWPQWRGPMGVGITSETDLPTKWSATENVKWKVPMPARGNSTPVVWGDKVFVTQPIEKEGRRLLICFDRGTGKKLWEVGTTYEAKETSHRTNPPASASPYVDGERVYVWFGSAGIFCYDLNGKELWHRELGKQQHEWGYAASPVIYKNFCILNFGPGENSFLIALDKTSGKTLWQLNIPEAKPKERTDGFAGQSDGVVGSWSTPIVVNASGRDELIVSLADGLKGFEPTTGKELWHCGGINPLLYTSPIYGDGVIVAMGGYHGTTIAVKPGGSGDVTKKMLWKEERTKNRLGSGVIHKGHIFIGNTEGVAECIELSTGKVVWEERLPGVGPKTELWSSMMLSGDKIYIVNQSGDCIILRASPKFEVIGVNSIGNELTNASVVPSEGDLFIRTHEHLWCIGKK
jgi:outer membrane protein assembly factor BamB